MFATGSKYLELMYVISGDFLKLAQTLEIKAVLAVARGRFPFYG